VAISLVIAALGWAFAPQLLHAMATPSDAFPLALAYLRTLLLSLAPAMLMTVLMQALRGAGDALTPFRFLLLSALLDAALNPMFILGLGPLPRLGIAGSGLATAIANLVSALALIAHAYAGELPLRLRGPELRHLWPDRALLARLVRLGLPMGLQLIVTSSSALVMLGLINRTGVVVTAAYAAMQQVWTYVQMPALSLGAAASAMAAQNIGAGRWDRVALITRSALWYNLFLTNLLVVIVTLVQRQALGLFLGGDSPALLAGLHIHHLATWGYFFSGVSLVLFGVVRGNGVVISPLIILVITMYPLRIGFAELAQPWLGANALWLSFPVSSVASAAMAATLYLQAGWRAQTATALPDAQESIERALAVAEPGGSLQPRG
jgi:putative MATE family efflux protein